MKKVVNINLGGYPFVMDEDAYGMLHRYLDKISRHFSNSEGCEDIMHDIEVRISELFGEELKGKSIVSKNDVESIIKVMGSPDEFSSDEETKDHKKESFESDDNRHTIRPGKKLYRNPKEKIVAGVCSGLAAYLGIEDTIWVRILFVILALGVGVGFPLYIILWIVMPKAKSAADELAMQGEPINVKNIAKKVEEGIDSISDTISELGKEFTSKKN